MSGNIIENLVSRIETIPDTVRNFPGLEDPIIYHYSIEPYAQWSSQSIEQSLGISLPDELTELWNKCSGLRLHEDMTYGQRGMILWGPDKTIDLQMKSREGWEDDFIKGDLIIGEFLGDLDLVVLRCDPIQPDFGSVVIALSLNSRKDWDFAAQSLSEFLERFLQASGKKYWQ